MKKRPLVNNVEFFFGLPSALKENAKRVAGWYGVSEAAFWRTAGRRLLDDLKKGRRGIEFR